MPTTQLITKITHSLAVTRHLSLHDMLLRNPVTAGASPLGIDPVLAIIVLELTDFRDAIDFFGPFLRNLTKDKICITLDEEEFIPPSTILYLAKKCQEHYNIRLRDRSVRVPGLDGDASSEPEIAPPLQPEVPSTAIRNTINRFIQYISAACLLDIQTYWSTIPRRHEIPLIRTEPAPLRGHGPQAHTGASEARSHTDLPSLDTSGHGQRTLFDNVIYSTRRPSPGSPLIPSPPRLGSSSPSLALGSLNAQDCIDPNSPYGRQVLSSSITHLDAQLAALAVSEAETEANSVSDFAGGSSFSYKHTVEATSTTALSAPSNDAIGSLGPADSIAKMWNSGKRKIGAVRRTLDSPLTSSRGKRSRDPSTTRSESGKTSASKGVPPLPGLSPSQSPIPEALGPKPTTSRGHTGPATTPISESPIPHISPNNQGFYDPVGVGVVHPSQPVVGLITGLKDISCKSFLSDTFWTNTFNHIGKCTLRFTGAPEFDGGVLKNPGPRLRVPADREGFCFKPTGRASGYFIFQVICCGELHLKADLECTKSPFSFPFPIDLAVLLDALESHGGDRAHRMVKDAACQFLLHVEALAAENSLRDAQ